MKMESRVEIGSSSTVDYEMKQEDTHRPFYKNMGFLVAVGLVMAGGIAAAVSIPISSDNAVNIAGESATQSMSRSKRQVTGKSITTFNTGLFGAVANYDERRGLFVDALKDEVDTDFFCQNELWYGKDVELLLSDKEWTTRYPYVYFFNNEEMEMRENGEDVPSLCPTKTIGTLLQLVGMESCKDKFNAAIDMTGKGYEDLVDDLFKLLECWEVEAPVMFNSIYNDKSCYGCLINAGSSGNIKSMANCMRGSTKRLPNDQAFESFLYGLALWSKVPLTNNEGNTLEWAVVPRAYISAEYEVDGVKGGIVCTHVAVEGKEQQTQFETITNHVAAREAEGVTEWLLAGDLNCGPESADGSIAQNPNTDDTNGVTSSDKLIELGWWGIYVNQDFEATWDMPMDAANNYFDGNTNICGHNTGIDCETLGSNDQRKMLLDHVYVRGEAFPRDADQYEAKIVMNKKYNASEDYEGVHISDHYGVQVIVNP